MKKNNAEQSHHSQQAQQYESYSKMAKLQYYATLLTCTIGASIALTLTLLTTN